MTTDEQPARWVVTGTAPDSSLWRREGEGFEALQAALKEAKDSGVRGIRTEVR